MIPRQITTSLKRSLTQFPIVSLTGPRQSGKTTLLRNEFPDYSYVLLEDPDVRAFAQDDPRAFLSLHANHVIFDEVQRVPELFSYLQGQVDETGAVGQYILSGSQNFLLMDAISQSLAGRVAIRHLPPLSYCEVKAAGRQPESVEAWVVRGGYPRLYDIDMTPAEYYSNYIQTYIDRDVRSELGVVKIPEFNRFVTLCATRIGNLVNIQSLAADCGINMRTAKDWLALLEQSFIIRLLRPYHHNYGKRLIKTPKLYFEDTGLACSLLGIDTAEDLIMSSYRGALFENAVVCEFTKEALSQGKVPDFYFWRDSAGREIDLIVDKAGTIQRAVEVKASSTYDPKSFSTLDKLGDELGIPVSAREVVYSGDLSLETKHGLVRAFADLSKEFERGENS